MSKLALLAQRRKEEAVAKEKAKDAASSGDATPTIQVGPSRTATPDRLPSKLAQKMAAARERQQAPVTAASTDVDMLPIAASGSDGSPVDDTGLFPRPSASATSPPSAFFDAVTATARRKAVEPGHFALNAHFPTISQSEEVDRRMASAFGPNAQSPDDVVLRARQGRGGSAAKAKT